MKLITMLFLLIGLTLASLFSMPANKVSAAHSTLIQGDVRAKRGYSAVGSIQKGSGDFLLLLRNPCATNSRPFYVKFTKPFVKRAVARPACPDGRKIDYFFVVQR